MSNGQVPAAEGVAHKIFLDHHCQRRSLNVFDGLLLLKNTDATNPRSEDLTRIMVRCLWGWSTGSVSAHAAIDATADECESLCLNAWWGINLSRTHPLISVTSICMFFVFLSAPTKMEGQQIVPSAFFRADETCFDDIRFEKLIWCLQKTRGGHAFRFDCESLLSRPNKRKYQVATRWLLYFQFLLHPELSPLTFPVIHLSICCN